MILLDLNVDVLGLPLHPLVVHLAVVALPVGALATIASIVSPWWRRRYGLLSLAVVTVGALGAFVAKESGEGLAETRDLPQLHAQLGSATAAVGLATMVLAWVWWWLSRRRPARPAATELAGAGSTAAERPERVPADASTGPLPRIVGLVTALAAAASVALVIGAGHTGATAVWADEADAAPATAATPRATAAASGTPVGPTPTAATPSASAAASYSLDEVRQHADRSSCWAAINGKVYDLTPWISQHPGGPQRILNLCGTDASRAFAGQHSGDRRPAQELADLQIGTLAG